MVKELYAYQKTLQENVEAARKMVQDSKRANRKRNKKKKKKG
jgi:hypothetical protein